MDLDLKDKRILSLMDLNARISYNEIAKKVKVSKEVARYRVKRLEECGIIRSYYCIFNSMDLKKIMYRVYFKLSGGGGSIDEQMSSFLEKNFDWVSTVKGDFDFVAMKLSNTILGFENLLNDVLDLFGTNISKYWVSTITHISIYNKRYFVKGTKPFSVEIKKGNENFNLDPLDEKIIAALKDQARISNSDIARNLQLTEKTVRNRIKKLQENKVILAFTPLLDYKKLGLHYFKILFSLSRKSRKSIKRIISFASVHESVVYYVGGIGCKDVEIEVQVKSIDDLYFIIDEFRNRFKDDIVFYSFMEYTSELKLTYY